MLTHWCLKLVIFFCLSSQLVYAQWIDEAKFGTGASFLGTGDMLVAKVEIEGVRNWNRIVSSSLALGIGHGNSQWYEYEDYYSLSSRTSAVHLDGNIFISPFGNDRVYHLKIGTGASLMYVRDQHYIASILSNSYEAPEHRISVGGSVIVEQEVRVGKRNHIGLKAMIQPYLNGDIANTLLVKFGRIL